MQQQQHQQQQQSQQQQQPPPQMFNIPPSQPTITTEQIQKYLDENKQLILAIMESQNLGKINECAQYQAQLQKNLMYLAAIADAQPPASTGPSQPQMAMQSSIPQGPFMPPPKPAVTPQQTGPRLPFVLQSFDQQSAHMQYQQSMAGSMGMRIGGNNGLRPAIHTGFGAPTHMMDSRRQDGSEAGPTDEHGKWSSEVVAEKVMDLPWVLMLKILLLKDKTYGVLVFDPICFTGFK